MKTKQIISTLVNFLYITNLIPTWGQLGTNTKTQQNLSTMLAYSIFFCFPFYRLAFHFSLMVDLCSSLRLPIWCVKNKGNGVWTLVASPPVLSTATLIATAVVSTAISWIVLWSWETKVRHVGRVPLESALWAVLLTVITRAKTALVPARREEWNIIG